MAASVSVCSLRLSAALSLGSSAALLGLKGVLPFPLGTIRAGVSFQASRHSLGGWKEGGTWAGTRGDAPLWPHGVSVCTYTGCVHVRGSVRDHCLSLEPFSPCTFLLAEVVPP